MSITTRLATALAVGFAAAGLNALALRLPATMRPATSSCSGTYGRPFGWPNAMGWNCSGFG